MDILLFPKTILEVLLFQNVLEKTKRNVNLSGSIEGFSGIACQTLLSEMWKCLSLGSRFKRQCKLYSYLTQILLHPFEVGLNFSILLIHAHSFCHACFASLLFKFCKITLTLQRFDVGIYLFNILGQILKVIANPRSMLFNQTQEQLSKSCMYLVEFL